MIRRLLVVCFLAAGVAAFAQLPQVQLSVTLAQPMPKSFTEWQRNDRNLVMVTVRNFDPTPYNNVRLSGVVKDEDHNKNVAWTMDNDPRMPRFTIPARLSPGVPGIIVLKGRDCINGSAIT